MTYSKTAWVNSGAPAINATNLNKIEQGVYDASTAVDAINAELGTNPSGSEATVVARLDAMDATIAGIGGSGGEPGCVYLSDFAGADADAKLTAALSYAAAQTYKPTIVFSHGLTTLSTMGRSIYTGLKLRGAGGGASVEQPRSNDPYASKVQINGSGTTPWLMVPNSATPYGVSVQDISFAGNSGAIWMGMQTAGSHTLDTFVLHNLGFCLFKHVLGSPSVPLLLTAGIMTGFWNINGSYDCAINIGGSDNNLWTDGLLLDSTLNSAGNYHARFIWLQMTNIGPIYMTADAATGGILIDSGGDRCLQAWGWRIGGRDGSDTHTHQGPVLTIQGDCITTLQECWISFTTPASGESIIEVKNGARATFRDCLHQKATNLPANANWLHADGTGTEVRIRDAWGYSSKPRVYASGGAVLDNDGSCDTVDMTTWEHTAETGLADGTDLTTGNAYAPDGFSSILTTGGTVRASTTAFKGSRSMAVNNTSNNSVYAVASISSDNRGVFRGYFRVDALPAAATRIVTLLTSGPSLRLAVVMGTSGALALQDANGSTIATTASTCSINTWYRLEFSFDNSGGTSAGAVVMKTYVGDAGSETANLSLSPAATQNLGATAAALIYLGRYTGSGATNNTIRFDDLKWKSGTTTLLGASA